MSRGADSFSFQKETLIAFQSSRFFSERKILFLYLHLSVFPLFLHADCRSRSSAKEMLDVDVNSNQILAGEDNFAGSAEMNKVLGMGFTRRRGVLSRIWNVVFRREDFEKQLRYLSKEEAYVHSRVKRRARRWQRMARNIISLSLFLEVIAVGYAIITTRTFALEWKVRAARVLPMFVLPGLSFIIYSTLASFTRMSDCNDQKTLERLRAERQAKIDELKEKTNYYTTQQLIQKYDFDPTAKAAAATILVHKLGAESGLKVYIGDYSKANPSIEKSNDIQIIESSGLQNRRPTHSRSSSTGSIAMSQTIEKTDNEFGLKSIEVPANNQTIVVGHHQQPDAIDGGWIAHLAALLVGEDTTECFALICGNCNMHNGLTRKEDFRYIIYYCPHCYALNKFHEPEDHGCASSTEKVNPSGNVNTEANSNYPTETEGTTIVKTAVDDTTRGSGSPSN